MTIAPRLPEAIPRLRADLGAPGLMIGLFSVLSFGFGLIVVVREYDRPRRVGRDAINAVIRRWAFAPDYLERTLVDHADRWRRASPADRPSLHLEFQIALNRLFNDIELNSRRFPTILPARIELAYRGEPPLGDWRPAGDPSNEPPGRLVVDEIELRTARGEPDLVLTVDYRVVPAVERAAIGLEASYRRLLLALVGLSGYSLLCLGYMTWHARALRERATRDAAREATLDLADRTCHELGNGVFVLSNERRNLIDHLDLVDRFVAGEAEARAAAARRAGLDAGQAARFDHAIRREYAARGIEPAVELRGGVHLAREVCRQIGIASEFIALTVRELDGYLKRATWPPVMAPVPVAEAFDECLALLAPKLQAVDARVHRPSMGGPPIIVRAERRRLVHALVNLVKNAVEAAVAAGMIPQVELSARVVGGLAWIEVGDRGPGLPAEDPSSILRDGFSTKGPARGRGLAIVRESIEAQDGRVEAEPREGGGATLRLILPIEVGSMPAEAEPFAMSG